MIEIPKDIDFSKWIEFRGKQASQNVKWWDEWRDRVKNFAEHGEVLHGSKLPWDKADEMRIRTGELTVFGGVSGHRKSMMLGQIALWLANQDHRTCIISLEMRCEETIFRMLRQAIGNNSPIEFRDRPSYVLGERQDIALRSA